MNQTLAQFIKSIENTPRKQSTLLIGIDGCGGSGKSTIAKQLQHCCEDVTIVHMDDFYLPSSQIKPVPPAEKLIGADFDWQRLLSQVIEPLHNEQDGYYARYDWETDTLAEYHTVKTGGIVVIEGIYATRNELANYYDFTIWVDCPRNIRLLRGLERDGEEARSMWVDNWMVAEDMYVKEHRPNERANLVIDGRR